MKTITMYELLGMVKDGKELPKKVKVLDVIYEFDDHNGDYYNKSLDRFLFVYMTSSEEWKLAFFLNDDEVEILDEIEEEKKIPEKWNDLSFTTMRKKEDSIDDDIHKLKGYIETIMRTQNEIIDYLKSKGE